jgi:hypothetical protein
LSEWHVKHFGVSRIPNLIPFDFVAVSMRLSSSAIYLNIFPWLSGSTGLAGTACFDLLFSALAFPLGVIMHVFSLGTGANAGIVSTINIETRGNGLLAVHSVARVDVLGAL